MATIRQGIISTKFNYNKIRGIPELGLEPLEHAFSGSQSSVASTASSASTIARTERRKISRSEGCFITGQTGYFLEHVHWVNAVRKDGNLKWTVETFLFHLGLVYSGFTLNAAANLTPMDRNLHYMLNKLSFFAVTCSKATLEAMIAMVDQENKTWEERGERYTRYFQFDQSPFSDAQYELVVLHPRHFLQKGSGLTVYSKQGNFLSGKLYVISEDGALREGIDNNTPRLPAFSGPQGRAAGESLNPFLVVLDAHVAFRRFQRKPRELCAEYTELVRLTLELAEKIYFKPLVNQFYTMRHHLSLITQAPDEDVHMESVNESRTIDKCSRMGYVVKKPGPEASHDEIVEFSQYLVSGRDDPSVNSDDDGDDVDLLSDSDLRPEYVDAEPVAEKVLQWQIGVQ